MYLLNDMSNFPWSVTCELCDALLTPTEQDVKMCISHKWEVTAFKRLIVNDWLVTQLSLFIDCPAVVGKRSRPQCHRQVSVHSPSQSVCQRQPPPHPAASQTQCLNQHPGLTGQHTTVCVNTYLSNTTLWQLQWNTLGWNEQTENL